MRFLIIDKVHNILCERLKSAGYVCDYEPEIKAEQVNDIVKFYQGLILRTKILIDKHFLDDNPQLKIIGRVGSGMENIDVQYARSKGIICLNSPEGNRDSVAEHTIALILSLLHNVCVANEQVKSGIWNREDNRGYELMGKVVGIIGYGNTGSAVAERLKSFGVKIIAYDKYKQGFGNEWVREVSLSQIFEHTDILTLHIPLTQETYYMVNKHFIKRFRKKIYLINTSRGQIVNTNDLVKFLQKGKIFGAALDVLEYEKHNFYLNANNEQLSFLRAAPNVILTPHIAGLTLQSFYKLSEVMANKILKVLNNNFV